jgi:hypothetical protein
MADGPWRFQCPECGLGHTELGQPAEPDELYCIPCQQDGLLVLLQLWEPTPDAPPPGVASRTQSR